MQPCKTSRTTESDLYSEQGSYTPNHTFSSLFLNLIVEYISKDPNLTYRIFFNDTHEQIEITRPKSDVTTSEGIPVCAGRLFIRSDGFCQFSLITGKVENLTVDVNADINFVSQVEPFLEKLDSSYVFCQGLPRTLPEVKFYPYSFQFSQDYPYSHVRSMHCFLWYKHTKGTSIRERIGMEKPRCSPCKRYLCVLARLCRIKQGQNEKEENSKTGFTIPNEKLKNKQKKIKEEIKERKIVDPINQVTFKRKTVSKGQPIEKFSEHISQIKQPRKASVCGTDKRIIQKTKKHQKSYATRSHDKKYTPLSPEQTINVITGVNEVHAPSKAQTSDALLQYTENKKASKEGKI